MYSNVHVPTCMYMIVYNIYNVQCKFYHGTCTCTCTLYVQLTFQIVSRQCIPPVTTDNTHNKITSCIRKCVHVHVHTSCICSVIPRAYMNVSQGQFYK